MLNSDQNLYHTDTIVARATAAGIGAIAVVRVSGPEALTITDSLLKRNISDRPTHTAHLRTLYDEDGVMDEALVTIFKGVKSYTGEDTAEVSLHGSEYIVSRVLRAFIRNGARLAEPGEFTQRAFLNGKLDLAQAEAVADVIASEHRMAHDLALKQLKGGFSRDIATLRDRLLHFTSLVELELDFAEEDVEFASREELRALVLRIKSEVDALNDSFALGNVIKKGLALVLAGRPNAGKSTLFNALLNEDRAIVSDIAGTTRDAIEAQLNFEGFLLRLIDTAGIREATDVIEQEGIARTFAHVEKAGATLYLLDVVECTLEEARLDLTMLKQKTSRIWVVCNKVDMAQGDLGAWSAMVNDMDLESVWFVSARDAISVKELRNSIEARFLGGFGELGDQTVVTNIRHAESLQQCSDEMERVLEGLESGFTGDLLAFHLRAGIRALSGITGEIGVEEILGSIFSKFCIGK
ncbi:MAG: tRNA uridine-5-carboxymethylaminomethyl(34) synthesis GTPase MnmE [Bacteroidetes bacterium]|jgi:tRNA modification GTPase|nr:tRNA uridine-5-carboxymethylaminomethyl(34) synthesis GTPase MnmE [Bacteroidota bacterium]